MADENVELLDYEEEAEEQTEAGNVVPNEDTEMAAGDARKTGVKPAQGYVSIHSSGFKDFLLKPELLKAIFDAGFEHPSGKSRVLCERANIQFYECIVVNLFSNILAG